MSYRRLSKKPLLFRSFTGLTVLEFDDVYKEIESKYEEYERTRRQHLSEDREKEKEKKMCEVDILFYLSLSNIRFSIVWKQQLQTPLENLLKEDIWKPD